MSILLVIEQSTQESRQSILSKENFSDAGNKKLMVSILAQIALTIANYISQ